MQTPRRCHPAEQNEPHSVDLGAHIAGSASEAGDLLDREALLRGQKRILESTARGRPLAEVLYETVRFLEERQVGTMCAVMLVDHSTDRLCYAAAPNLPDDFLAATDGQPLEYGAGGCALAVLLQEAFFIHDLQNDPRSAPYADLARRHAIAGCWSMPARASTGETLGVLVVFARGMRNPQPDWNLLAIAGDLVSIAVERSRAEEARNLNLFALMENMGEGVVAVDADQNLLVINPAALRLLGLPPSLHREPLATLDLPPLLKDALRRIVAGERAKPERLMLQQGLSHLSAYVSPVGTDLGRFGALALLRDVTEEVRLRRLQESFLANVSHELRAPLAVLSAALEGLVDGVIPEAERPRYLQLMMQEMERLRRLSYDVVELTRLEAGASEAESHEFALDLLFESLGDKMSQRCRKAGIRLAVELSGLRVRSVQERVERALEQLLENAVHFTPGGGQVRVHAMEEGRHARILVEDSGIGIPKEHLPLIWERFYKVDPARRREPGSGTGLGLAIVRQILSGLGSEMGVESEEGRGSTFHFTLPLAPG